MKTSGIARQTADGKQASFRAGSVRPRIKGSIKKATVGLVLLAGLMMAGNNPARAASSDSSTSIIEAMSKAMAGGMATSGQMGFDATTPFSVAFINRGSYSSVSVPLEAGVTYLIVGAGDEDATDVDVIVHDGSKRVMAQDLSTDRAAVASFTPRYGGNYTVFLKLHSSKTASSACVLSLLRDEGGYRLPTESFSTAVSSILRLAANCSGQYHTGTGEWTIVGSILRKGESFRRSGIKLREGPHVFLAAGDGDGKDIDLRVYNVNNRLLDEDTDSGRFAGVTVNFSSRQTCSLEIINSNSSDWSLVLGAVIEGTFNR